MRIFKDDTEYQGTPEEIAHFMSLREDKDTIEAPIGFVGADFADPEISGLKDTISESEMLRKELAQDPNYNPFPGVSPSPDSSDLPSAESDTGVKYV